MTRGSIVLAALSGDTGKPRPWIVLRADRFAEGRRVTLLPMTSDLQDWPTLRVDVAPTTGNGLRQPSQVMIDRIASPSSERAGQVIGQLGSAEMQAVERAVLVYLGFAD